MLDERQQRMFRRHAIEKLGLSVTQAEDWVDFYQTYGPPESLIQWENTLLYRSSLLKAAKNHDAKFASASEPADAERPTPIA